MVDIIESSGFGLRDLPVCWQGGRRRTEPGDGFFVVGADWRGHTVIHICEVDDTDELRGFSRMEMITGTMELRGRYVIC